MTRRTFVHEGKKHKAQLLCITNHPSACFELVARCGARKRTSAINLDDPVLDGEDEKSTRCEACHAKRSG